MSNTLKYVSPKYAKSGAYAKDIQDIKNKNVCPFCPKYFPGTWHTNPILKVKNNWLITKNMHPYKNVKEHFIIVGKQHLENITSLTIKDFATILYLSRWTIRKFDLSGGMLGMRFGQTKFTGATVKHLHAHLITPSILKNKVLVVNFPIG